MSERTQTQGEPDGQLILSTMAMPADTNPAGDIFGGWIVSQMDLARAGAPRAASSPSRSTP
jgi:acyl-CoA thioesterase YciA